MISPTDDNHAVSLVFRQLGQFRPQYTTITGLRLRVPNKMQVLDFQTLVFFFFLFAPRLHHRMESFKLKSRHFHILSIKTALFVDKPQLLMVPSMKTAIFVDSKRFYTGSIVDLVRGTNCTLHGITQKSLPGSHSRHTDFPEDKALSPHHEIFDRFRSCKKDQEPPSKKYSSSPKSSPQCTRYAATGLCCGLFYAAPA